MSGHPPAVGGANTNSTAPVKKDFSKKVIFVTFIIVLAIYVLSGFKSMGWNTSWVMFGILVVFVTGCIGGGALWLMNSESPKGEVDISAVGGAGLIALGVIVCGLTCLPMSWQDQIRNIYGQDYSPRGPEARFVGDNVTIDLVDPTTNTKRDADVIYVQAEVAGNTTTFDWKDVKFLRVFFRDKDGKTSLAREVSR